MVNSVDIQTYYFEICYRKNGDDEQFTFSKSISQSEKPDNIKEYLDLLENACFYISKEDVHFIREIAIEEVEYENKKLYDAWYEKYLFQRQNGESVGAIPPSYIAFDLDLM